LYNSGKGIGSNNVFIAMAFTDETGEKQADPKIRDTILSVLGQNDLGFNAKIVDKEEHNEGIVDKILALINESRFVVAELTHQKSGVYYEAGYAKGIGLPVIHIVKKDDFAKCHFDIKHLNLIVWDSYEELKDKLRNRVLATIRPT
jgi:nucleoside 2-deoxyribosyltransferase